MVAGKEILPGLVSQVFAEKKRKDEITFGKSSNSTIIHHDKTISNDEEKKDIVCKNDKTTVL